MRGTGKFLHINKGIPSLIMAKATKKSITDNLDNDNALTNKMTHSADIS